MSISTFSTYPANILNSNPSDPIGGTSSTGTMCGFAFSFTQKYTGKIMLTFSCNDTNTTINDGCAIQMYYGTGAAPVNGAAITGTSIARQMKSTSAVANEIFPMVITGSYVTGLTLGTAYWIDVS